MEPVFERRIHMYINYIEGFWHMAQRDEIWLRLHEDRLATQIGERAGEGYPGGDRPLR